MGKETMNRKDGGVEREELDGERGQSCKCSRGFH